MRIKPFFLFLRFIQNHFTPIQHDSTTMAHLWHDISVGKNAPRIVNGIIEIPSGSKAKYEINKSTGTVMLDRIMHGPFHYPTNYGFIPQTLAEDGDPLDILVLSQISFYPGILVEARVIGVMEMTDKGELDHKIIAVAKDDPFYKQTEKLSDIPQTVLNEIKLFFQVYKTLELKPGQSVSVDNFLDEEPALKMIQDCIQLYRDKFDKKSK